MDLKIEKTSDLLLQVNRGRGAGGVQIPKPGTTTDAGPTGISLKPHKRLQPLVENNEYMLEK